MCRHNIVETIRDKTSSGIRLISSTSFSVSGRATFGSSTNSSKKPSFW